MPLPRTPIPSTISYQTPPLPATSRGPWTLDRDRVALLVHDMQGYFLRAYEPACPALLQARTQLAELLRVARVARVPIVYTAQPGDQPASTRGLLTPIWGPGIGGSDEDAAVVADLAPEPDDRVLVKHRYSAFVGTDLGDWLTDVGRDQLLVTGVYAHIGVLATATDALMRDVEPFVAGDAVVDFSPADHERALVQLASVGAAVIDSATALAALAPPATATADDSWQDWLAGRLGTLLGSESLGQQLVAQPELDLFEAGLDSLRCFELIDDLAAVGVDVDFSVLASEGTSAYLLSQLEQARPAA
ncbi:isochorismatase [Microlunatus phosphovorus NM-1]|uniref:Isochorismatase n=1 Tax=Microlunatus phosphovorus (strain ATCC 700054 / DSM 10555 / JCM 9379 / NBRC 101784 / NCIMB 13414 / VKM Ac-1990 / NM-1) TaxID=1032480 RepID=F5XI91_MICPN|nr:isochorismatase family protein [Microlunatus phosphovorus]BAK35760.1 isochorismatase [Microlunatus phosphovorus NM-1]